MALSLPGLVGLAGVHTRETPHARRWGRRFDRPMLVVAMLIPLQWYVESSGTVSAPVAYAIDWFVWLLFLVETAVLLTLVEDRARYLAGNWMNLVIIASGVPILWNITPLAGVLRSFRLLLLLGVVLRASRTVRVLLARNRLGSTLAVAAGVVLIAGVFSAGIDPAIESPADGLWWALVTVTTVGYGDVVPVTTQGRLFGAILIVVGLVLFALLTANISAFLIDRQRDQSERSLHRRLTETNERLARLEQQLHRLLHARVGGSQDAPAPDETSEQRNPKQEEMQK